MKKAFYLTLCIMGIFSGLFGNKREQQKADFPPVPDWEPAIEVPIDKTIATFKYYTDGNNDFVIFKNGTCVIVKEGLSENEANEEAKKVISQIFNYHPDMNPTPMDDGNILVRYNHPAYNVVLKEITEKNKETIEKNHLRALATSEVLMTPQGPNKFDEFGMNALFGRCYFFMDAKDPKPVRVVRKTNVNQPREGNSE